MLAIALEEQKDNIDTGDSTLNTSYYPTFLIDLWFTLEGRKYQYVSSHVADDNDAEYI